RTRPSSTPHTSHTPRTTHTSHTSHTYYAAFLDLRGRPCVVVGGGEIGLRKAEGLGGGGARVSCLRPEVREEIAARANVGELRWVRRAYQSGDLGDCFLVVGATGVNVV